MTGYHCITNRFGKAGHRFAALLLALCMIISTVPAATAASLGNSSASLYEAPTRTLVQVPSTGANFFTGETYGTGTVVTVAAGSVWILYNSDYYTVDGVDIYGVFYNNEVYHVRVTDVTVLTEAQIVEFMRNSIWGSSSYTTLKQSLELRGDVRVYALQYALNMLGYYSDRIDGNYGQVTDDAVYKFQKANGLTHDGDAGPLTQQALYAVALGKAINTTTGTTTGTTTTTTSTSGTLRTTVSVNFRESYSTSSGKITTIPVNTVLTFMNTQVSGGVTWYQVVYGGHTGWVMGSFVNVTGTSSGSSNSGTLTTKDSVNLRKSASKSSTRLGVVPMGVTLAYSDTSTSSGVTWYKVAYGVNTGWLMGTYVTASGTGGTTSGTTGGTTTSTTITGTLQITKPSTRVRSTPNGSKTGVVLSTGTQISMTGSATSAGGYSWYPVVTASGVHGYVRSDCATVISTSGGTTGGTTASNVKKYIRLPANTSLFLTSTKPTTGLLTVPAGSILQMVTPDTYTGSDNVVYCKLYYGSTSYNAVYSEVSSGIMTDDQLAAYVVQLWNASLDDKFYNDGSLVGDVRVYATQLALYVLGYYTGSLDGSYGADTASAVRNFQRAQSDIDVDGVMGNQTWSVLAPKARAISNGYAVYSGSTGTNTGSGTTGGTTTGTTVTDFGTINSISKPTWSEADLGNYWPKYSFATVMDVTTGKVFTIYRTGGVNHPDAVPYTEADTQTMCEIVGFTYPNRRPTSDELAKIVADADNSNSTYTWPDYKGTLTGVSSIGSAWDRRPALLNVNGQVYAVSIYGWPHGFMGINSSDGLSQQKFPNGNKLYENNNFYGCFCVRFYDSYGHSSTKNEAVKQQHNAAADTAYTYAKNRWPSLVK